MKDQAVDADYDRAMAASLADAAQSLPQLPPVQTAKGHIPFKGASSSPSAASASSDFSSPHTPRVPPIRDPAPPPRHQPSCLAPVPPPPGLPAPQPPGPAPSGTLPKGRGQTGRRQAATPLPVLPGPSALKDGGQVGTHRGMSMPPGLRPNYQPALPQGIPKPSSPGAGNFPPGLPRAAPSTAQPAVSRPPGLPAPKPSAELPQRPAHSSRSFLTEPTPAESASSAHSAQQRHSKAARSAEAAQQTAQRAKPAASQTTSVAAKKATAAQVATGKSNRKGSTGKQAANSEQLTLDELQQKGKTAASCLHPTALKVAQSQNELLTKLAAELAPGEAVTAVSAKQCHLEAAVAEKYTLSTARSAVQAAAADRATDKAAAAPDAQKSRLVDASQRAAQTASIQQIAADNPAKVGPGSASSAKVNLATRQPEIMNGSKTAKKKAAKKAKMVAAEEAGAAALAQARAAAEAEAQTQAQVQAASKSKAAGSAATAPAKAQVVSDIALGTNVKPPTPTKPAAAAKTTAKAKTAASKGKLNVPAQRAHATEHSQAADGDTAPCRGVTHERLSAKQAAGSTPVNSDSSTVLTQSQQQGGRFEQGAASQQPPHSPIPTPETKPAGPTTDSSSEQSAGATSTTAKTHAKQQAVADEAAPIIEGSAKAAAVQTKTLETVSDSAPTAHQQSSTSPVKSEAPRLENSQPHRPSQQGLKNTIEGQADVPDQMPPDRQSCAAESADKSAMQQILPASAASHNSNDESLEPHCPPKQGRTNTLKAVSQTDFLQSGPVSTVGASLTAGQQFTAPAELENTDENTDTAPAQAECLAGTDHHYQKQSTSQQKAIPEMLNAHGTHKIVSEGTTKHSPTSKQAAEIMDPAAELPQIVPSVQHEKVMMR